MPEIQNVPGKIYRPRFYGALVPLATQHPGILPVGIVGRTSLTINNFPFLFKRWRAAIVGDNQIAVPTPAAVDLFQDGQFSIRWYLDNDQYMNEPMIAAMFVDPQGRPGATLEMLAPIEVQPKETIHVEIMNLIPRAAGINVDFVAEGVEPR